MRRIASFLLVLATILLQCAFPAMAGESGHVEGIIGEAADMTAHPGAIFCLVLFFLSYLAVLTEEKHRLRKSKPVMLGAGIIWVVIALIAPSYGLPPHAVRAAVFEGLAEYSSLLLFLLSAMTFISTMQERRVFSALRSKLVQAGLDTRQIFWVTGIIAFFMSSVADNLTTSLVLGAVVMAVGANDPKFVGMACINVVNAANAGGTFCPFGDITTLMVWQAGHIEFFEFFDLFLPALVCFLIPAAAMSPFIPKSKPWSVRETVEMKRGAKTIIALGALTIAMAVTFEQVLDLPPFLGMMMGLALLLIFGYVLRVTGRNGVDRDLDILDTVATAEWDTLLFFFGVMFSVGGLAFLGYLEVASHLLYGGVGAVWANIALGVVSAVIDNIPVMFAVLTMHPDMNHHEWMLITLTTGIGGSLLSVGSAAGVALMGIARQHYTFSVHLKWTPVLALGYAAAVGTHLLVNGP